PGRGAEPASPLGVDGAGGLDRPPPGLAAAPGFPLRPRPVPRRRGDGGMNGQAHALRRFLIGRGAAPGSGSGTTLVVASGKVGVGTPALAALLALRAAEEGRSPLLVDAEAGHGTLHLIRGVEPGPGLAALRCGMLTPRDLLVPVVDRLQLVTAG